MQETEFTSASDALAKIPANTEFLVKRFSGGRPQEVVNPAPDRKAWNPIEFDTALRMGMIDTKSKYHLIPIISGQKSTQKITLNLAVENTASTSTGSLPVPLGQPDVSDDTQALAPRISQSPHLQEIVVDCLIARMSDDRQDLKELHGQNIKLIEEKHALELENMRLKMEAEYAEKIASNASGANQFLGEIMKSPALPMLLQAFNAPKALQEAAKQAQAPS